MDWLTLQTWSVRVRYVFLDIALLSLPLPMLYRLQVTRHAKAASMATFGLGLFTIIAGSMRLEAVIQIDYQLDFHSKKLK